METVENPAYGRPLGFDPSTGLTAAQGLGQKQYEDALELEAGKYTTERDDIAAALGLEAERFELGRDMGDDPESLYIGMTSAQKLEHQRLTAAALKSAGADVSRGSFLSRVASTMLLTGYEATEISELQDQIDGYLADNMRGDDLSDENVLAALLWLGKTDIAMSALNGLGTEQLEGLVDAMSGGGAGGTAFGTGTSQMGAPASGSGDLGPAETAGALTQQDAFDANVRELTESGEYPYAGKSFNEVYADLYGDADKNVRRNLREPEEGFNWGAISDAAEAAAEWAFQGGNIDGYPEEAWELMPDGWGTGGPMTGNARSEEERIQDWLKNKSKTHKWVMAANGMRWERK